MRYLITLYNRDLEVFHFETSFLRQPTKTDVLAVINDVAKGYTYTRYTAVRL